MDIIQSYVDSSRLPKNYPRLKETLGSQAKLSCKLFRKHNFNTILYTSQDLKDKVFIDCPYDSIITIEEEECKILSRNNFWSAPKLIACLIHNKPFIHADIDLFLIENILENIDKSFITLHLEPWLKEAYAPYMDENISKEIFFTNIKELYSFNCGLFGGENIKEIHNNIKKIFELIRNDKQFNDKLKILLEPFIGLPQNRWIKSVTLEQIILVNNIKNDIGKITNVIDTSNCKCIEEAFATIKKNNIIHLWVYKPIIETAVGIENFTNYLENYIF